MKFRSLFVLVVLLSTQFLNAQVVNIPDKAKNHFAKKYVGATDVERKNNVVNYTARFKLDSIEQSAHYSVDGESTYTDYPIGYETVPEEVKKSVTKSRFSDWTIESTGFVENSKNEKLYRVEFKSGINKRYVFYNANGKEVRSTATL